MPEVTSTRGSWHPDSLTAVEIYWALAKIKTHPACEILMTSKSFPTWVEICNSETHLTALTFDWQAGYPMLWPCSPPLEQFWQRVMSYGRGRKYRLQGGQNTAFVQREFLDGKDKKPLKKRHQWESGVAEIIAVISQFEATFCVDGPWGLPFGASTSVGVHT